ncbi:MAG: hypothetical protein ABSG21_08490 [Spirochaetia bacterium]|jgi:hypothetical protein
MPTRNPPINVIEKMAQERGLSLCMVTRDWVREALEIHEDAVSFGAFVGQGG